MMLIATHLITHSTKACLQSIPETTSIIGGLLSRWFNVIHVTTQTNLPGWV